MQADKVKTTEDQEKINARMEKARAARGKKTVTDSTGKEVKYTELEMNVRKPAPMVSQVDLSASVDERKQLIDRYAPWTKIQVVRDDYGRVVKKLEPELHAFWADGSKTPEAERKLEDLLSMDDAKIVKDEKGREIRHKGDPLVVYPSHIFRTRIERDAKESRTRVMDQLKTGGGDVENVNRQLQSEGYDNQIGGKSKLGD